MFPITLGQLWKDPAIAILRTPDPQQAFDQAVGAIAAGFLFIEITATISDYAILITHLRRAYPQVFIGAGSVLAPAIAQTVLQAGAQFLFSPILNLEILDMAHRHRVLMIPGALTPNEIVRCFSAGAVAVKVFPITSMGGVHYLKQLYEPLGSPPLIPTGGVTLNNTLEFLAAGAVAVGIGSDLFPKNLDPQTTQQRLNNFVQRIRCVRASTPLPQSLLHLAL